MLRPTALIPALCCAAAAVLSFLCLFAGDKPNFMEGYHLITLNTSRIGENIVNTTSGNSDNPLSSLYHNITNSIGSDINDAAGDIAEKIGIDDWYSAHLLDYCFGSYIPGPVANATLAQDAIHKNVSGCSNRTTMYHFDPTAILQQKLNQSGVDITLKDLDWPADIQKGINAIRVLQKAVFVIYCIAIGFELIALLTALFALFASGRLAAFINIMVASLALIAIGIASAIVTAVIVKGSNVINKYGNDIGVEAHRGGKFLAITWAATGVMVLACFAWCFECIVGHRRRRRDNAYVSKHG